MANGPSVDPPEETTLPEIEVSPIKNPEQPESTTPNPNGGGETGNNGSIDQGLLGENGAGNGNGGAGNGVNTNSSAYYIPDLDEARNLLKSVAPDWRFIAILPKIDKQVGSGLSVSEAGAAYSSAKKLSTPNIPIAVCSNVDISPVSIDTDQRYGGGMNINVARTISTSNVTLTFYEDEDYNVSKYIWAWHKSVVTDEKLFYLPKDYKKEIKIWAFGNRSNSSPNLLINLIDCFPVTSASGLSYSLSNSGFLQVSVDFTVDGQDQSFASRETRK